MKMRELAGVVLLALIVPVRLTLTAQGMDQNAVLASIDQKAQAYAKIAMQIWSFAEVGYQETKSSALLQEQLKGAGFAVTAGVAEIPRPSRRHGGVASRSSVSLANSMRCPVSRKRHHRSARRSCPKDRDTDAAIICLAPRPQPPQLPSRTG